MAHARPTPTRSREWVFVLSVAFAVALALRALVIQTFEVTSTSMQDTLEKGDRVVVEKVGHRVGGLHRGDIVVFDGRGTFSPAEPTQGLTAGISQVFSHLGIGGAGDVFVKRVIGLPGDRIRCCSPEGALEVNGTALAEPWVRRGDDPSLITFDVVVPDGRVWLMGDHRSVSADSRAHLGSPGGGTVALSRVIGTARVIAWPRARWTVLSDGGS